LALRPDIGQHRTAWVTEVIFKTSVASEHHYLLAFSKHKQFNEIPIKESDMVTYKEADKVTYKESDRVARWRRRSRS
jgi:hypothetical protein